MTEEEFLKMLEEISAELPMDFFQELNGGIIMQPEAKYHPESKESPLWILGEYAHGSAMGRYINIYYGSFIEVYGNLDRQAMKKKSAIRCCMNFGIIWNRSQGKRIWKLRMRSNCTVIKMIKTSDDSVTGSNAVR